MGRLLHGNRGGWDRQRRHHRREPQLRQNSAGDRRSISRSAANNVNNKIATSQIALPKSANDLVYASSQYPGSASNQSQVSLASDMVFSDGASLELPRWPGLWRTDSQRL